MHLFKYFFKLKGFFFTIIALFVIDVLVFRSGYYDKFLIKVTNTASNAPIWFIDEKLKMCKEIKPEIIVLGDSRVNCSFNPILFDDLSKTQKTRTLNLALRNSTIEDYYYAMKNYPECFENARTIIWGVSLFNFNDNLKSTYLQHLIKNPIDLMRINDSEVMFSYIFNFKQYFPINFFKTINYEKLFTSVVNSFFGDQNKKKAKNEIYFREILRETRGFEPMDSQMDKNIKIEDYVLLKSIGADNNNQLLHLQKIVKNNTNKKFLIYFNPVSENFRALYRGKYRNQYMHFYKKTGELGQLAHVSFIPEEYIYGRGNFGFELFAADGHHLNEDGSRILTRVIFHFFQYDAKCF